MSKQTILITGSSGNIGSTLVCLLELTYPSVNIIGVDKEEPVDCNKFSSTQYITCDITDEKQVKAKLSNLKVDVVIHLAALVSISDSLDQEDNYFKVNVDGTANIIHNVECKNFIFASTCAAEHTTTPYGISKARAEELVKTSCSNYTIYRFANVIGLTHGSPTKGGLFDSLCKATDTFYINGNDYDTRDGTCIRDYIGVIDVCWSLMANMNTPTNNVELLGRAEGYTVLEIVNIFKEVNQREFDVRFNPRRVGDVDNSVTYKKSDLSNHCVESMSIQNILKV